MRGYKHGRDGENKPIIVPEGGETQRLVIKSFKEFATGVFNIEELRRRMNKEGLKISRNTFWTMLRNKGYLGKVYVPEYGNEKGIR